MSRSVSFDELLSEVERRMDYIHNCGLQLRSVPPALQPPLLKLWFCLPLLRRKKGGGNFFFFPIKPNRKIFTIQITKCITSTRQTVGCRCSGPFSITHFCSPWRPWGLDTGNHGNMLGKDAQRCLWGTLCFLLSPWGWRYLPTLNVYYGELCCISVSRVAVMEICFLKEGIRFHTEGKKKRGAGNVNK